MKNTKVPLSALEYFSPLFKDYISQKEVLQPFYAFPPDLNGIRDRLTSYPDKDRGVLVKVLKEQYEGLPHSEEAGKNIRLLSDPTTFTITTGHQLNIFTGPLYFIYKIISVIRMAEQLKLQLPDKNFVPVYWMASEDHDFEEINNFTLFGKKYVWSSDQQGAVGRFTTKGMEEILLSLPEKVELFEKAYLENENLADATREIVNALFGRYGVVVIDGDQPDLKRQFVPVLQKELEKGIAYNNVSITLNELTELGYSAQVNPREINLFYLTDGVRERIIKSGNNYIINNTDLVFSTTEILHLLQSHPERFSPNVLLRPVYQEVILPNIAYVGGPAEVAYWLELKGIFEETAVPFPVILPRNFVLYISTALEKKLRKLDIPHDYLMYKEWELKEILLQKISDNAFDLSEQDKVLKETFDSIALKAKMIDPTLEGNIMAERQKALKQLEDIEKRLKKAEEKKNSDYITQVINIRTKLFPNGGLQERTDNFLNFYINDPSFIDKILSSVDPFSFDFNIISEEV